MIIKNHHEPIISREMFEKAEKIFLEIKHRKILRIHKNKRNI